MYLVFSFSITGFSQESRHLPGTRSFLSFNIRAAVVPKTEIRNSAGTYILYSKLHSAYSAGFAYHLPLSSKWGGSFGFGLKISKSNFFCDIKSSDLQQGGIHYSDDLPPIIYYKNAYLSFVAPVQANWSSDLKKTGNWQIAGGLNLNYSGFSKTADIRMWAEDTAQNFVLVFNSELHSNNNSRVWITGTISASRSLVWNKRRLVVIGFFVEYSGTRHLSATYEITIPNKPPARGVYSVTGSAVGIAVSYPMTRPPLR
ncbi:MAG TPA: hypothetical protein VEB63_04305 [Chitinophagaceae bacterium]|nr:hypothetical protein [Chitinophagaceae bacterium]